MRWLSLLAVPVTFGSFLYLLKTLEDARDEARLRAACRRARLSRARNNPPTRYLDNPLRPWFTPEMESILNGDRAEEEFSARLGRSLFDRIYSEDEGAGEGGGSESDEVYYDAQETVL